MCWWQTEQKPPRAVLTKRNAVAGAAAQLDLFEEPVVFLELAEVPAAASSVLTTRGEVVTVL